ncbi:hypothetical protein VFPBJ_11064 [Purpureocillium lilacinum]|uniref:Uncharacterized protein n=1 Tax=Purpureocillium lilacinum TaxID=33203 RepID=A0A179FR13_PURLI|nr:hypothetical protein VFPBJ_11064 [Purpureocillium lilacinum]
MQFPRKEAKRDGMAAAPRGAGPEWAQRTACLWWSGCPVCLEPGSIVPGGQLSALDGGREGVDARALAHSSAWPLVRCSAVQRSADRLAGAAECVSWRNVLVSFCLWAAYPRRVRQERLLPQSRGEAASTLAVSGSKAAAAAAVARGSPGLRWWFCIPIPAPSRLPVVVGEGVANCDGFRPAAAAAAIAQCAAACV